MSQSNSNPYYLGRPWSIGSDGSLYVEVRSTEELNAGSISLIQVGTMANKASYTTKYVQKDGTHETVFTIDVRIVAKPRVTQVVKSYLVRETDFCDSFHKQYPWFSVHGECLQAFHQAKKDSHIGKGGHWLKQNIKPCTGTTDTPKSATLQSSSSSSIILNPPPPPPPHVVQPLVSGKCSKSNSSNNSISPPIQRSISSGLNKQPINTTVSDKHRDARSTTIPSTLDQINTDEQPLALGTPDVQLEKQRQSQSFSHYLPTTKPGSQVVVPQLPQTRPTVNKVKGSAGSKTNSGIMNYV